LPERPNGRNVGWLLAIVLVALNLRGPVTSVPPLAVDLRADLDLGSVATGALTTVPVLCMGLFAPVAALATRWWRESTVLSAGLALIVIGAGLRSVGGASGLYAATALAGVGIAVGGTLLPGLVRTRAPHQVGPVTGMYTAALICGAFASSTLAEPARDWLGVSAQKALAVWAAPAAVAFVAWLVVSRADRPERFDRSVQHGGPERFDRSVQHGGPERFDRSVRGGSPWRDSSAWVVTAFMAIQSLLFYGSLAWLPVSAREHGMSARDAGLLLGLFTVTQVVTAFAVPALAHRTGDLRPWMVVTVATTTTGLLLIGLIPYAFPAALWLWGGLCGLGMGGHFALALNTITQVAPSVEAVPAYSGMAFLFGYSVAAVGPVLLGFLADVSGGYRVPFLTLTVLGLVALALGVAAANRARERSV
jgi:CP family cyanate transporter-like MFS transporter